MCRVLGWVRRVVLRIRLRGMSALLPLILRLLVALALLVIVVHPSTPEHWRLSAGTVLGAGLVAVLVRDHRRRPGP